MLKNPPELKVAEGDLVKVLEPTYSRRSPDHVYDARVVKVARAWITLQEITEDGRVGPREWRMRKDKQDDGTDSNYRKQFRTLEQYEVEKRQAAVYAYLREQGLDTHAGPWASDERRLVLANLLRAHEGLPLI